jgi:hypothetical protein
MCFKLAVGNFPLTDKGDVGGRIPSRMEKIIKKSFGVAKT